MAVGPGHPDGPPRAPVGGGPGGGVRHRAGRLRRAVAAGEPVPGRGAGVRPGGGGDPRQDKLQGMRAEGE